MTKPHRSNLLPLKAQGRWIRSMLQCGLCIASVSVLAEGRLRVPEYAPCPANNVTSWQGTISHWQRDASTLVIELATDADTQEQLQIASAHYAQQLRLNGEPWQASFMAALEASDGQLPAGWSATVWLCVDDSQLPVVNLVGPQVANGT